MMTVLKVSVISTIALLFAGCGGTQECSEPKPYERSQLGKPIEAPEGLDPLDPSREMTIPQASPRPPRSANAPCLEYPPTFGTGDPEQPPEEAP